MSLFEMFIMFFLCVYAVTVTILLVKQMERTEKYMLKHFLLASQNVKKESSPYRPGNGPSFGSEGT